MDNLSYDYTYADYAEELRQKMKQNNFNDAQKVIESFQKLREKIFNLRYKAEQINLDLLDEHSASVRAELELIIPVLKKLSDSAEFITDKELADWRHKHE